MKRSFLTLALLLCAQTVFAAPQPHSQDADPNMVSGKVYAEARRSGACGYADQGTANEARLIRAGGVGSGQSDRARTAFSNTTRQAI